MAQPPSPSATWPTRIENISRVEIREALVNGTIEAKILQALRTIPDFDCSPLERAELIRILEDKAAGLLAVTAKILNNMDVRVVAQYALIDRVQQDHIRGDYGKYILGLACRFWKDYLEEGEVHRAAYDEVKVEGRSVVVDGTVLLADGGSDETLELVDDVWAEFEKAGLDGPGVRLEGSGQKLEGDESSSASNP